MDFFVKKLKPVHEMTADPDFSYKVGRLIGAAEMAGHILSKNSDPAAKHIGEQLAVVVDWFFVAEKVKRTPSDKDFIAPGMKEKDAGTK